jgi:hypothetical protein
MDELIAALAFLLILAIAAIAFLLAVSHAIEQTLGRIPF